MNFKSYIKEASHFKNFYLTIKITPIQSPYYFYGAEYDNIKNLKQAVIRDVIEQILVSDNGLEVYNTPEQEKLNLDDTPYIKTSFKSLNNKNLLTKLEKDINFILQESQISPWKKTVDFQLEIISETDLFKKGLKRDALKTFGGMIDEL